MVKLQPLLFLFLVQFLVVFLVLSIIMIIQYRKLKLRETISRGEANMLKGVLNDKEVECRELSDRKKVYDNLQSKFEHLRDVNIKLREYIMKLVPEASRSEEFKNLLEEIEGNNKELDTCIVSLKNENEQLAQQTEAFQTHIKKLTSKLALSVGREEHENTLAQKKSLGLKYKKVEKALEERNKEYESLQKNYAWLEKEYNALYTNVSSANIGSS